MNSVILDIDIFADKMNIILKDILMLNNSGRKSVFHIFIYRNIIYKIPISYNFNMIDILSKLLVVLDEVLEWKILEL